MKATMYYATWCGPCQATKAQIKGDPELKKLVALVDGGRHKAAADAAKVQSYPTLVREDGARRTGYQTAASLRKWLGIPKVST